ncbi:DUF4468 domain-containing protein [Pedobacter sp. KR3-3]|uniref:DUF4468 domain-containing protein n=1 Tax=Pedobacter albus TaxID=3113905 RepID=A0ABU7I7J7_9SPHI|nr:DUF4468 domain-containing protein [Pedobacter sp. KR3-3]MEE1945436.1 DUF4468 domain-containing protein [Pedobacter sp. KR3-3]
MKIILLTVLFFFSCRAAIAQSEGLAINENGKFIYYEVVKQEGTSKDLLKSRLEAYLKKQKNLKLQSVGTDSTVLAKGKFVINKTLLVVSHPSGEVLYNFNAEVKEGKYRFWLSDFGFIPYQRDRYGNFVATTAKAVPLEENPGKLNEGQWKEYRTQTAQYAQDFATKLKQHMANEKEAEIPVPTQKVVSKSW